MPDAPAIVLRNVEGWPLGYLPDSDVPLVRDVDMAERLGYERPRDVRKLIDRLVEAGKLGSVEVRDTVAQTSGGRPGREFWLTEAQALKVAARSETEPADALLDDMIRVFMLARRGELPAPPPVATLPPAVVGEGARMHRLAADALEAGDVEGARRYQGAAFMLTRGTRQRREKALPPPAPPPKPIDLTPYKERLTAVFRRAGAAGLCAEDACQSAGGKTTRVRLALHELLAAGTVVRTTIGDRVRYVAPVAAGELQ